MTTVSSRTFRSGNSEALRLPRDVAFGPDVELTLVRSGEVLTVFPRRPALATLLAELLALPRPASIEVRDVEPIPERLGLQLAYLLDTNVAIRLRDGDVEVGERIARLDGAVLLSIISRVELEGGVHRDPASTATRRTRLERLLSAIPVLDFDARAADAYRAIVESAGYSRRKLLDRMIAAQAITHRATLVTTNGADFRDILGLELLEW